MEQTFSLNVETLRRLQARADQEGCSADALLLRWLESDPQAATIDLRFIEAAYSTVLVTDAQHPDQPIVYVNAHFEQETGYRREEVIGKNPRFLQGSERDQTGLKTIRDALKLGKPATAVLRNYRKDGTPFWNELRIAPVYDADGRMTHYIGIQNDVSEHQRTLEQLNLQNTALEATANAIVITDPDSRIQWVNGAFTQLSGYTLEEAQGQKLSTLVKSGYHDPEFYASMWQTIVSGGVWFGKMINRRKDGSIYSEEQTITPVFNNDGEISFYIAIKQDVTAREHSEQLALDHERLKARFQKEQEQNALIQRIISALSHDLRTALAVILSSRDILSRYFHKLSDEQRQEKLNTIGHQIRFALSLLEDTVQMARGNLNQRQFQPAPVNLATLCKISVDEMCASDQGLHEFHFHNLGGVEVVTVDEILISRILLNLLSNASKYSEPGREIRLELDRTDDDWIILRVIDQGIGIGETDLPHIFEPLYRSQRVGSVSGSGLGLSIVKDCVERHHGHIQVESVVGHGTAFTIKLPVAISLARLQDAS